MIVLSLSLPDRRGLAYREVGEAARCCAIQPVVLLEWLVEVVAEVAARPRGKRAVPVPSENRRLMSRADSGYPF